MPNIVVTGAQWGDEGKGKIVDLLAEKVQVVARYNGGHNAGHTVIAEGKKHVLHVVPSGILHAGVLCLMGNGMVIEPEALEKELATLRADGVEIDDNLLISDRAHLVLPHHRALEALAERERGARKIGTTLRGIGPAYEDKAGRRGVRIGDLLRPQGLPAKLAAARQHYETLCRGAGCPTEVDWDRLAGDLAAFGERIGRRIADVTAVLYRELALGSSVLFEGAQATLLDLDFGTYPFVTSSSAAAGGPTTGLGVPPTRIDSVIGIMKAYITRVGGGPMPTEIGGALEEQIRKRGGEYGASTGRPRRCGWFDAVVMRHSVRVNGFDSLAVMKLDVLDGLGELQICTGYRAGGAAITELPSDVALIEECQPVYETLPGWSEPTVGVREYRSLPQNAQRYLERLSDLVGAEIGIVSTGPDRIQTIFRAQSRLAAWLQG
jgi:adenylosuccinate synthase